MWIQRMVNRRQKKLLTILNNLYFSQMTQICEKILLPDARALFDILGIYFKHGSISKLHCIVYRWDLYLPTSRRDWPNIYIYFSIYRLNKFEQTKTNAVMHVSGSLCYGKNTAKLPIATLSLTGLIREISCHWNLVTEFNISFVSRCFSEIGALGRFGSVVVDTR